MKQFEKGIILAGGDGSRLHPITRAVTKQLLPVYDKPLIYYPLSVLMLLGIREILFIVKPEDLPLYERLFHDGSQLGVSISYKVQIEPRGLPEAFTLGREFIGDDPVTMILGDNIIYGSGLIQFFKNSILKNKGATSFAYRVNDPERFGVVNYDEVGEVANLEEKPQSPLSNYAVIGLYHFDQNVAQKAADLKPSQRGELEIVDLLNTYLKEKRLNIHRMPRGYSWLDTGTSEALIKAGQYVQILEERQGVKIGCIEEIAFAKGYIDKAQFGELARDLQKSAYGDYLFKILDEVA